MDAELEAMAQDIARLLVEGMPHRTPEDIAAVLKETARILLEKRRLKPRLFKPPPSADEPE